MSNPRDFRRSHSKQKTAGYIAQRSHHPVRTEGEQRQADMDRWIACDFDRRFHDHIRLPRGPNSIRKRQEKSLSTRNKKVTLPTVSILEKDFDND